MAKTKTLFICQACAHESPKWLGRCPGCDEWNTLVEEIREDKSKASVNARTGYGAQSGDDAVQMADVQYTQEKRISSGIAELDRVLGGGFVSGGVILLGGDPGIGKSTLSLQVAGLFAREDARVLYVSGEESLTQLKMRGERLFADVSNVWVVGEIRLEHVEKRLREQPPSLLIIDSIQTLISENLSSSAGSVAQLREVTASLTQLAKGLQIPTILVGHVTKEGSIAGPKILEHMVDTVLYFEGEQGLSFRILRAVKNRYGSTNEIGVFEMRSDGLHEVTNPSAMFLAERPRHASGSIVFPVLEGSRPVLVEIQALVSPNSYGPPRITAVGVEQARVLLLMNIIEKRTGLKVAGQDVFVNVAGGTKISETAADLGIGMAILSSFLDKPIPEDMVVFGEVGLTGEVRAVSSAPSRIIEAQKLGFHRAVLPTRNASTMAEDFDGTLAFRLEPARTLADAIKAVFGAGALAS